MVERGMPRRGWIGLAAVAAFGWVLVDAPHAVAQPHGPPGQPPPGPWSPPPYGPPPGYPPGPPPGYPPRPPAGYPPGPPQGYPPGPQPGYYRPPPPRPTSPEEPSGGAAGLVFGLSGTHVIVDGDAVDESTWGLGAKSVLDVVGARGLLTAKLAWDSFLGGGSAALEGRLRGVLTGGVIGHLGDHHGPFLRLGIGGDLEGNDDYYFSYVELPVAEGGYHIAIDHFALDLGARVSPALTARYFVGPDAERSVGTVANWGAFATLFAGPVWLDTTLMRLEDESPVYAGWAHLCGGYYGAGCFEASVLHGTVEDQDATTYYLGVTLGFGLGKAFGSL